MVNTHSSADMKSRFSESGLITLGDQNITNTSVIKMLATGDNSMSFSANRVKKHDKGCQPDSNLMKIRQI